MDRKIGVSGTYVCDPIKPYLEFWFKKLSVNFSVEMSPYNQIFQSLLSETNEARYLEVFLIRFQDWGNVKGNDINLGLIEETAEKFINLLEKQPKKLIKIISISPNAPYFQKKYLDFFELLETKIAQILEKKKMNALLISHRETLEKNNDYYDEYGDVEACVPYIPEMYAKIATMVTRKIFSIVSKPPKVVVLDCDETLWSVRRRWSSKCENLIRVSISSKFFQTAHL